MPEEYKYNKDLGDFDLFLKQNIGLVHRVVREFRQFYMDSKLVEREDLFQEAQIAFYKSYVDFDPSLGYRFSSLCVRNMRGYLLKFIRDRAHLIRKTKKVVQVEALCKQNEIKSVQQLLTFKEELDSFGVSPNLAKDIFLSNASFGGMVYLDAVVGGEDSDTDTLMSFMASDKEVSYDFNVHADVVNIINSMNLKEQERVSLEMRALGYTLSEIGKELGVSKMWISKILKRVEDKVKVGAHEYYAKY